MNFDKLIEDMFTEGMTSEDIAKAFTTALNKRSEQEKAAKKRDSVINDFKQVFISRIKERRVSHADAAALSTIIASNSPEGKDWTAEQIDDFYKFTCDMLDSLPKQFNLFEKVHEHSESLTDFIETMESMIDSVTNKDSCGCGGNCHSKTEPCDDCKIHKPAPSMNDAERIRKFLEGLGK